MNSNDMSPEASYPVPQVYICFDLQFWTSVSFRKAVIDNFLLQFQVILKRSLTSVGLSSDSFSFTKQYYDTYKYNPILVIRPH